MPGHSPEPPAPCGRSDGPDQLPAPGVHGALRPHAAVLLAEQRPLLRRPNALLRSFHGPLLHGARAMPHSVPLLACLPADTRLGIRNESGASLEAPLQSSFPTSSSPSSIPAFLPAFLSPRTPQAPPYVSPSIPTPRAQLEALLFSPHKHRLPPHCSSRNFLRGISGQGSQVLRISNPDRVNYKPTTHPLPTGTIIRSRL
jgi:hypothetical protein